MSMTDLGPVETIGAEAIGQPGQRRFRLFARTRKEAVVMWLEKEQLRDLGVVIDRILAQLSEGRILRTEARAGGIQVHAGDMPLSFPNPPDREVQIGQMRLSYEEGNETLALAIVPLEIELASQEEPQVYLREEDTLTLSFTPELAQNLTARITFLMTSGRPVCPLCHTPLDGGPHACVKQNGHREVIQMLVEDGEEEEDEEE